MGNLLRITSGIFDKKYFSGGGYATYEKDVLSWVGVAAKIIDKLVGGVKNSSVLDAGCAHGYLMDVLQNKYGIAVRGLEYSDYAIKTAVSSVKKKVKKGNIVNQKLFKKNSFDAVICLDVFSHLTLQEIQEAAKNLAFWTKKYVIFSAIYRHSMHASQKINPDEFRITTPTQKEYRNIFRRAGARFVKKIDFGNGGGVFLFEKK